MKIKAPKWILAIAIAKKQKHIQKLNKELQPEYEKILTKLYELIGQKEDEEQYITIAILCLSLISGFTEHQDRQNTIQLLSQMEQALK